MPSVRPPRLLRCPPAGGEPDRDAGSGGLLQRDRTCGFFHLREPLSACVPRVPRIERTPSMIVEKGARGSDSCPPRLRCRPKRSPAVSPQLAGTPEFTQAVLVEPGLQFRTVQSFESRFSAVLLTYDNARRMVRPTLPCVTGHETSMIPPYNSCKALTNCLLACPWKFETTIAKLSASSLRKLAGPCALRSRRDSAAGPIDQFW